METILTIAIIWVLCSAIFGSTPPKKKRRQHKRKKFWYDSSYNDWDNYRW